MVKTYFTSTAPLAFLLWHAAQTSSFVTPNTSVIPGLKLAQSSRLLLLSTALKIRGGDASSTALNGVSPSAVATWAGAAMQSGPVGVVALAGIASSVVLPLTMYRQAYSFSVGYGASVFAMGLALVKTFDISLGATDPVSLLAAAVTFYGARLGLFLLFRQWTVPSKAEAMKKLDKTPRLKRIPLALGVSIFYACMASPLMYAARAPLQGNPVVKAGVFFAWTGALMEAVADGQKWWVKRLHNGDAGTFVGPTSGLYRLCRHPNYFGELVYWFGLALAGAPSFGTSPIAWGCALTGLTGIYGIMTSATKRLEGLQGENYKGQEAYENYTSEVAPPIWPWSRA